MSAVSRDILVDGYNIIKKSPAFRAIEVKNLAAARAALVAQLVSRYRHTPHRVFVVFDGDGSSEQVSHERRICIIYSRYNETADSVIARLGREARSVNREVELYSDDGEVRQSVAQQHGSAHSANQLTRQLNAPSRDVELRAHHRLTKRREYGLDPAFDPDDEPLSYRSSKGGKKKSSRRR
ncbi:MAG: NYN domain-containing protein [Ktedonobacteraceae bacterium]